MLGFFLGGAVVTFLWLLSGRRFVVRETHPGALGALFALGIVLALLWPIAVFGVYSAHREALRRAQPED